MKKTRIYNQILVALCALVVILQASPIEAQQHHFFTHGFLATKSSMEAMAGDMGARYAWTEPSILPDYASLFPTAAGIAELDNSILGVYPQLHNEHPGEYVGLGWSLGGLIARYEAKTYGSNFINGLVADHSPNDGVNLGDFWHRAWYIPRWIEAEGRLLRGDLGFLYFAALYVGGAELEYIIAKTAEILHAFITIFVGGVADDLAPSSGFLNGLNGTQPSNVKRVVLWGTANYPYYPAYTDEPSRISWVKRQADCRNKANDWNNKANSVRTHWYMPWRYVEKAYDRSRAADWNSTAGAMDDLENAWEYVSSGTGQESDGLVSKESQQHIPSYDGIRNDNYTDPTWVPVNHGAAVFDHAVKHFDQVKLALDDAGAQ